LNPGVPLPGPAISARCGLIPDEEARALPPHGAQQDLLEAIERREFPSRTVKLQILTEDEARAFPENPFPDYARHVRETLNTVD
jgi:catalase